MENERVERGPKRSNKDSFGMVASRLRRHISRLKEHPVFVTRDVLYCGKRAAVDSVLFRFVQSGELIRIARGVFIPARRASEMPTLLEIIKVKAAAFNRKIFAHAANIAAELRLHSMPLNDTLFSTDGGSTSFFVHAYGKRVELKNICPRKLDDDSAVARAVRATWLVCKAAGKVEEYTRRRVAAALGREGWDRFLCSFRTMPAWLWNDLERHAQRALPRYQQKPITDLPSVREAAVSYGSFNARNRELLVG